MTATKNVTLGRLREAIESVGGQLANDGTVSHPLYSAVAPKGKLWSASRTHCLPIEWRKGATVLRQQAIDTCFEDVGEGLADCNDENCGRCADLE